MKASVFYSWQSDLSSKTNRSYLEGIITKSLKAVNKDNRIIACIDKHIVHHLYSDKLMNLIYKMIEPNEDQRIDFEDLMEELNKNFK